jgi:hypothetical protein
MLSGPRHAAHARRCGFAFVDEPPTRPATLRCAIERVERSGFLPELDVALLARLAAYEEQQDALDELRRLLA